MKKVLVVMLCSFLLSSCIFGKKNSGGSSDGTTSNKKTGCPSNGKNVGAERILSGEKVPKARKFKA